MGLGLIVQKYYYTFVGWRARRIPDPVDRLRYLRRTARVSFARWSRGLKQAVRAALLCFLLLLVPVLTISESSVTGVVQRDLVRPASHDSPVEPNRPVWKVEVKPEYEVYSNGLRVEMRFLAAAESAGAPTFQRLKRDGRALEWRPEPFGIVYHTTESHMAPFEQNQNHVLKRFGEDLLAYVKRNRAYHFVIDRFGRVYQTVPETEAANHAGRSVWADNESLFINLNHSFLGVAFEAQSRPDDGATVVSPAQVHAAGTLTALLRSRYGIPASLCLTHAQVSVNPLNMKIGYHTDWAASFPFSEIGLPDNYALPPPAITELGFGYDPIFVRSTGAPVWKGLLLAEEMVRQHATANGMTVRQHRTILEKSYREVIALVDSERQSRAGLQAFAEPRL